MLLSLFEQFPNFKNEVTYCYETINQHNINKLKFNGNKIKELININDKDIGKFMKFIKDVNTGSFENIYVMVQKDIDVRIKNLYNEFLLNKKRS